MTAVLFLLPWLGVCAYALWRGGQPERLVALLFIAAFAASVMTSRLGYQWHGVEVGIFGVDLALLILLLFIALRANRYWPIGLVAMQLLQVTGHLLKLADPRMLPLLYWIGAVVWAYPMLLLLLLGTIRHRNRVKRLGAEPSWSSSSRPQASATGESPPR